MLSGYRRGGGATPTEKIVDIPKPLGVIRPLLSKEIPEG